MQHTFQYAQSNSIQDSEDVEVYYCSCGRLLAKRTWVGEATDDVDLQPLSRFAEHLKSLGGWRGLTKEEPGF